jgi:hypothetical protein
MNVEIETERGVVLARVYALGRTEAYEATVFLHEDHPGAIRYFTLHLDFESSEARLYYSGARVPGQTVILDWQERSLGYAESDCP